MANTLKFGDGKWATGEGTALAFNDENDNFKPLPFTFTRNSTATVVNESGLIEEVGNDVPRIDFKDNTKGALLLEPQRTNSLLQSNQFDTTWFINASALDLTSGQSGIYGSNDAWLLKKNITGSRYIQQQLSLSSAQYSYSVYMKAESTNWAFLWSYDGSESVYAYIDLENGVVGNIAGSNLNDVLIESVGDGWYRVTLVYTQGTNLVRIYPAYSNGNASIGTDNGIYIQYAQVEQGSYTTSYIKTEGSAVTRLADSCSQTVPDGVIGQTEGTMFFKINYPHTDGVKGAWSISDNSSANRITMNTTDLNSTQFTLSVAQNYNSSSTKLATANVNYNQTHKVAIKYSSTTLKLFVNGTEEDSVTTDGFGNYTKFFIGANQVGALVFDLRKFSEVKLYDTALSDSELETLTT